MWGKRGVGYYRWVESTTLDFASLKSETFYFFLDDPVKRSVYREK